MRIKLSILFLCLLPPSLAYSTPNITGISGTITNGSTITITGTNLYNTSGDSKPSAGPMVSSYDNPTSASNFSSHTWTGSQFTRRCTDTNFGNSAGWLRSSLYQSSYYVATPHCTTADAYSQLRWDNPSSPATAWYISFWQYITDADFGISGPNLKDVRWYGQSTGTTPDTLVTHWMGNPANFYEMATEPQTNCSFASSLSPKQVWRHIEWWFIPTSNTTGSVQVLIDGVRRCNWTSLRTLYNTHTGDWWRFGEVSGAIATGGAILHDQMYIDNTQAHVFISDKSDITNWLTYGSVSHNEIQVPSAWSASSIQVTLNRGTFGETDSAYLYVVDSAGAISNAYPITFGEIPTNHSVTLTAGAHGSITESSPQSVAHGGTLTVHITPDSGFIIDQITDTCGTGSLDGTTYTSGTVSDDCEVSVAFKLQSGRTFSSGGSIRGVVLH